MDFVLHFLLIKYGFRKRIRIGLGSATSPGNHVHGTVRGPEPSSSFVSIKTKCDRSPPMHIDHIVYRFRWSIRCGSEVQSWPSLRCGLTVDRRCGNRGPRLNWEDVGGLGLGLEVGFTSNAKGGVQVLVGSSKRVEIENS